MRKLNYFQLSLFGNFSDLKADLSNMQKLANALGDKQFLPTVTNHQNIDVLNGTNTSELRISLISKDGKYNVQILPERIDYLSNYSSVNIIEDERLFELISDGCDILEIIMREFNLVSNRLALNIQFINIISDDSIFRKIYNKTINFLPFYNNTNVFEWQLMSNSRGKIVGLDYQEDLNTISYVMPTINSITKAKGIMLQLDINTIQENLANRFYDVNLKEFYIHATKLSEVLNNQFEDYIKDVK